ncbi:MAG: 30S ribosome-binding factor RbfA [Synergistales bacterium]|nr:30S ribosome-binding factor RbfA [Synergistales bacterium]
MAGFRMERINKELQRELSKLIEFTIKVDDAKKAVITGVDCSRDLKVAKVYFTTIIPEDRRAVSESLKKVSTFLRTSIAKTIRMRTVPSLSFVYDASGDYGRSIDLLLDKAIGQVVDEAEDEDGEEL